MTPQMGVYTLEDDNAIMAAHTADADAHHPEEVAEGRAYYGVTNCVQIPGVSGGVVVTQAMVANRISYFPFWVKTPITLDLILAEVTAAAAGGETGRLAIYEADLDFQPTNLVVDSGPLPIDANAVISAAIAVTLQEGRYLFAINVSANATFRTVYAHAGSRFYFATLGATALMTFLYVAVAYAAFTDPGTVWNLAAGGANHIEYPIFVRVSVP